MASVLAKIRHAVRGLFVVKDEEGARQSEEAGCLVMGILDKMNPPKPEKGSEMLNRAGWGTMSNEKEVGELPRETKFSTMHLFRKYPSPQCLLFLQRLSVHLEHTLDVLVNCSEMELHIPLYIGVWAELYSTGSYHYRGFPNSGVGANY